MFGLERIYKHYNLQLFLCSGLLTLSSANYGFDVQGFAKTQAMTPFIQRFGQCNAQGQACFLPSYWLSMFNSLPTIAHITGIYIGSVISARYGRRMTCFVMSLWACVSATIIITSNTKEQIMAARVLNYLYIGMELSVIPVYQSEIMPAPVRGFAVASYQMSFAIGNIFSSVITKITADIPNDWSWRVVFCFYYLVPGIVASGIWFLPESPRWLLSKGRVEQARANRKRVRVDSDPVAIEEEIQRIQAGLDASMVTSSYRDLFRGNNKRRILIVMGSNFFQQATGQAFVSLYGPIFVRSLNFIDVFLWGIIQSLCGFVVCIASMVLVDKIGRRPMMIGGSFTQAIFLLTCGGLGLICFVVSFSLPYAINEPGNLGSKVGFYFGAFALLACLFAYFFVPECKGRSFEEVNLIFIRNIPARATRKWKPEHDLITELHQAAGTTTEEDTDKAEEAREEYADVNKKV